MCGRGWRTSRCRRGGSCASPRCRAPRPARCCAPTCSATSVPTARPPDRRFPNRGVTRMPYPLEVGGVEDYPVKVGSMLLTLVDPNKGYERAYNRWYERDHFYAGCMEGPYQLAGSRWVATRELKDLRWPKSDAVASPVDAGSYVAIYWVLEGKHKEWDEWAQVQVHHLYS